MRLRSLCGMTAEQFSRKTGIGYAQLVAVEQGRRELSPGDALQISAATGVDPSFNEEKSSPKIMALWGVPYGEQSNRQWQERELPALREQMARLRAEGARDVFAEVVADNAQELLAAARVRGQELAVAHALSGALTDIANRFDLGPSLARWKRFEIRFDDPRPGTQREKRKFKGAVTRQKISCSVVTTPCQGIGRAGSEKSGV